MGAIRDGARAEISSAGGGVIGGSSAGAYFGKPRWLAAAGSNVAAVCGWGAAGTSCTGGSNCGASVDQILPEQPPFDKCPKVLVVRETPWGMTPAEFDAARKHLGWSHRETAAELQVNTSTIFRWIHGDRGVPGPAAVALRTRIELELLRATSPEVPLRRPPHPQSPA